MPEPLNIKKAVEILYEWDSPERIWKARGRLWYLYSAGVTLILIFAAYRLEYYGMIVALIAFLFLWFLQANIPPQIIRHKITTKGVYTGSALIRFDQISGFWISKRDVWYFLHLDKQLEEGTDRISMLIEKSQVDIVFESLMQFTNYLQPSEAEFSFFTQAIVGSYVHISQIVPSLENRPGLRRRLIKIRRISAYICGLDYCIANIVG